MAALNNGDKVQFCLKRDLHFKTQTAAGALESEQQVREGSGTVLEVDTTADLVRLSVALSINGATKNVTVVVPTRDVVGFVVGQN